VPVFSNPGIWDTTVRTLILVNSARTDSIYGAGAYTGTIEPNLNALLAALDTPGINAKGVVIDLANLDFTFDSTIVSDTYAIWDAAPGNPLAANYVAASIKSVIYNRALAYPNVQYVVLVGGDRIIPHRRIRDEAIVANERTYASIAATVELSGSLGLRYLLSDDYYAGLLPLPYKGRELYVPQLALGRLVETPSEIQAHIDSFLNRPNGTLNAAEFSGALVTGYDFLIDNAIGIGTTLRSYDIPTDYDTLVNNKWDRDDFTSTAFDQAVPYNLISLNSHFTHYFFYPNGPNQVSNYVFAQEIVDDSTNYNTSLIFSVGCHSGLNVPDERYPGTGVLGEMDWAQAFFQRKAAGFIGNTGFGYGDTDVVAYSEKVMNNFVEELGYEAEKGTPNTVGMALMRAKQRYVNDSAASSFSNYDEKAMAILTYYGLPMLKVQVPNPTFDEPGGASLAQASIDAGLAGPAVAPLLSNGVFTTAHPLTFNYTGPITHALGGTYYELTGDSEATLFTKGGKPILPLTTRNVEVDESIAHGTLMIGGTFLPIANFNPAISLAITDSAQYGFPEPAFPFVDVLFPGRLGITNKLLTLDGHTNDQLVIIPIQFRATGITTPTVGNVRQYSALQFEVYHAPESVTDFTAPAIWQVEHTVASNGQVTFNALITTDDQDDEVERSVLLVRPFSSNTWQKVELTYNTSTDGASGTVSGLQGRFEYFVQAVDSAGNVSLALDHGLPYQGVVPLKLFLPLIRK
jgi:hypothetical protein